MTEDEKIIVINQTANELQSVFNLVLNENTRGSIKQLYRSLWIDKVRDLLDKQKKTGG